MQKYSILIIVFLVVFNVNAQTKTVAVVLANTSRSMKEISSLANNLLRLSMGLSPL